MNNGGPNINRILRYNAQSTAFLGFYDNTNVAEFPLGFRPRAIYFDDLANKWVGLYNGGLIYKNTSPSTWWANINYPKIFPYPTIVSPGAIVGDKDSVYIGTDSGLVVYSGLGLNDLSQARFKRYTTRDGLPSNFIRGICIDTLRGGIWAATDNGIAFMKRPNYKKNVTVTAKFLDSCYEILEIYISSDIHYSHIPVSNKFVIELSDEFGSFNTPTFVGETPVQTNTHMPGDEGSPLYFFTIPSGLPLSNAYRVKVTSTNPEYVAISNPIPQLFRVPEPFLNLTAADDTCDDGQWIHFFNKNGTPSHHDDKLLLSIKKNNNGIGYFSDNTLKVSVGYALSLTGNEVQNPSLLSTRFWAMSRYWEVKFAQQPTSPVGIRFYYKDKDLYDLNADIPYDLNIAVPNNPAGHKKLVFYTLNSPDANPALNFYETTRLQSLLHTEGINLPNNTWKYKNLGGGIHMAEFEVTGDVTGGGGGITANGGPLNKSNVFSIRAGNWDDPSIWSNNQVPDRQTELTVSHDIIVNIENPECKSLKVAPGGFVMVLSGARLNIIKE